MIKLNGKFNRSKAKILFILYLLKQDRPGDTSTAIELYVATGIPYGSIKARLSSWHRWRYITRQMVKRDHTFFYGYKIAAKGTNFVERVRLLPEFEAISNELVKWQSIVYPIYQSLNVNIMSARTIAEQVGQAWRQLRLNQIVLKPRLIFNRKVFSDG